MIGALIGLILLVLVIGVVWYCIQLLMALLPISEPFATIIRVLMILLTLVIVIWAIMQLLSMAGIPMHGFSRLN